MEEVETTRTNQSAAQAPFGVLITSLFCFFFFVIYTLAFLSFFSFFLISFETNAAQLSTKGAQQRQHRGVAHPKEQENSGGKGGNLWRLKSNQGWDGVGFF